MTDKPVGAWLADDFEDIVVSALIACFESKITKNKLCFPQDRLSSDNIPKIRAVGPYIPSNSRYVEFREESKHGFFDLVNDELPTSGCFAFIPAEDYKIQWPGSYLMMIYLRRTEKLGKYWHTTKPGKLFEIYFIAATKDGITGDRRYVTVTNSGNVWACDQSVANIRGYCPGRKIQMIGNSELLLTETGLWASVALQTLADRRHCWLITAQEDVAKAHIGCMKEEIKSLLYARSLPMTSTGRKRPILHLVEAHKRRIRNGIDIDVTTFLRGTQTVEIGGTLFSVKPPAVIYPQVSKPSQQKYFNAPAKPSPSPC